MSNPLPTKAKTLDFSKAITLRELAARLTSAVAEMDATGRGCRADTPVMLKMERASKSGRDRYAMIARGMMVLGSLDVGQPGRAWDNGRGAVSCLEMIADTLDC